MERAERWRLVREVQRELSLPELRTLGKIILEYRKGRTSPDAGTWTQAKLLDRDLLEPVHREFYDEKLGWVEWTELKPSRLGRMVYFVAVLLHRYPKLKRGFDGRESRVRL